MTPTRLVRVRPPERSSAGARDNGERALGKEKPSQQVLTSVLVRVESEASREAEAHEEVELRLRRK